MSYEAIATMVSGMGLPYAYFSFPENQAPNLPYIVYHYPNNNDFGADNINYVRIDQVNIELYTENKDFETESSIEAVLKENGFYYEKTESYLRTEQMYMVLYEIQAITEGAENG